MRKFGIRGKKIDWQHRILDMENKIITEGIMHKL